MFISQRYDFCRAHYQLSSNNDTATSQFSCSTATVLCSINLLDSDIFWYIISYSSCLFVCGVCPVFSVLPSLSSLESSPPD